MSERNVTLREVAKKAGVSIATVSRVLNESNYVSPEIQKTVRAVVKELGYYQNSAARSLKTNSSMTVGFVTADISNPYMINVAGAVEDLIWDLKYSLVVCSTHSSAERELEYLKLLMGRGIDGLLLNGTGSNADFISDISNRIPVVLLHRSYDNTGFIGDLVDSDNEDGVYALTKHLIRIGHKRIFVVKGQDVSNNKLRLAGFARAMREAGIDAGIHYPYLYGDDFTIETGYRAVEKLLGMEERATAILALNNTLGLGVLQGLAEHNLRAPEDISVAHYNSIDHHEMMLVRPMMHHVDPREVGFTAGKALLARMDNNKLANRAYIVKGKLIPGNAVGMPLSM
ncbi:MAG: LacI family transcriptional regulator [Clostridiales bacterium]|jgi:LacI family transcriptional regulator|nr:LacI family transcriptional regulator [Clostridiales bacterium]